MIAFPLLKTMKRKHSPSSSHARRGGIRQRLKAAEERDAAPTGESALCFLLLSVFSWGEISPQLAQRIAHAGYEDAKNMTAQKTSLKDLEKLARIGSSGVYGNKCYGNIMKTLPIQIALPEVAEARLPFKGGNWLPQSFLLPHELFARVFHCFKDTWRKCVVPSTARLEEFWRSNCEHPAMAGSDLKERAHYQQYAVPISMHGDDVPITGVGKSWAALMTVFSWSSIIGAGTTADMQWFIYGCFEKLRVVNEDQNLDTLGVFFTILKWSFHWLYKGCWPDRDWNGKL